MRLQNENLASSFHIHFDNAFGQLSSRRTCLFYRSGKKYNKIKASLKKLKHKAYRESRVISLLVQIKTNYKKTSIADNKLEGYIYVEILESGSVASIEKKVLNRSSLICADFIIHVNQLMGFSICVYVLAFMFAWLPFLINTIGSEIIESAENKNHFKNLEYK